MAEVARPRGRDGRFLQPSCPDPNCDGVLVFERESTWCGDYPKWRCDGLTYRREDGPLVACDREEQAAHG